jgi:hypothetical protein
MAISFPEAYTAKAGLFVRLIASDAANLVTSPEKIR